MLEPENPTESGSESPENSASQVAESTAETTSDTNPAPARKAPRKAAPRKAAKATPVEANEAGAPDVAPVKARAPRKSAKKVAEAAPTQIESPVEALAGATLDAPVEASASSSTQPSAPAKAPRRRATKKAADQPQLTDSTVSAEPTASETAPATESAAAEPAPTNRTTRRRSNRATADSAVSEATVSESNVSEDTSADKSNENAGAAPFVLFVPPSEVATPAKPRTRRRATDAAKAPVEVVSDELADELDELAEDGLDPLEADADPTELAAEAELEADAEETREAAAEEATGARRRRRRGRRGRGGRSTADSANAEAEGDSGADAANEDSEESGAELSAEADEQSDEQGSSSSRRRRRRRRADGGNGEAAEGDDPPNTVVHVRAPRGNSRDNNRDNGRDSAVDDDGVRGVKGSTRLEAKRQRRRDGRDTSRRRPPILTESEFLARRESVDRVMAVRELGDRTQIAVLEDDILVEHYVTRASSTAYAGNIYLGRVQNVLPSMEAAFIDIGKARNGVLYAGEVNWDAAGIDGKARAIEKAMSSGDTVLVQVTKDPVGQKGARLTSQISLPGRFLVYVPNGAMTGISRKLPDVERTRLKSILKKIVPEDAGVIVRTAAEGASEADLTHDVERLKAQWEAIQAKAASPKSAPVLLYGEPDLAIRVVRDVFNEDFNRLVVQGDRTWQTISEYVNDVAPDLAERASKYVGTGDLFHDLRVDEQLTKALDRKVYLPSGGSLVIDRTEAMTVVDVNTGKFVGAGGNLEQTVTRNNLEAAEEIVRQLRLRDVGGIVVIDFIDMVLESNRELVLRRLTECLGRDRTKHQVAEVTSLGLVQMTRKRVGEGLLEAFSEPCEHCKGRGVIVHSEPVGIASAATETVDEGGSRRKGRRGRGRSGATNEPIEVPESASDEQRRAAAEAMAAMAGFAHAHDDDHDDHDGHDHAHDEHDHEPGSALDGHDDGTLVEDVFDADDTELSTDADLDGAAAEPIEREFAAEAAPSGSHEDATNSNSNGSVNGHAEAAPDQGFAANDWLSDATAAAGEPVNEAAEPATEEEPAAAPVPATTPIGAGAGRRPRRRAASRPAGPPSSTG